MKIAYSSSLILLTISALPLIAFAQDRKVQIGFTIQIDLSVKEGRTKIEVSKKASLDNIDRVSGFLDSSKSKAPEGTLEINYTSAVPFAQLNKLLQSLSLIHI